MEKAFLKLSNRHRAIERATPSAFERFLLHEINWESALVAVVGPRGVGKTTLLIQQLRSLHLSAGEALYIDLGDLLFQNISLLDFAEWYIEQGGKYLFLDEVHRYPRETWATEIKSIYDVYRTQLKVVLSGSSIIRILDASADLSRRVHYYYLPGLSFREYLQLKQIASIQPKSLEEILNDSNGLLNDILQDEQFRPISHFQAYLERGYYGFVIEDEHGYYDQLNQMVQLVLGEDIGHATGMARTNSGKLAGLLQAVASSVPFKPNISKLAERIGLTRNTVIEYLHALDRAGVIMQLRADGKGITPLGKPDKIYLDNPNLIYALAPQRAVIGAVRETFFYNQLSSLRRRKLAFPPDITLPKKGDFRYIYQGTTYTFEVGGPNKTADQIGRAEGYYTVVDAEATAMPHRIPLWLFGLMY